MYAAIIVGDGFDDRVLDVPIVEYLCQALGSFTALFQEPKSPHRCVRRFERVSNNRRYLGAVNGIHDHKDYQICKLWTAKLRRC